jgi:hypothetical protein
MVQPEAVASGPSPSRGGLQFRPIISQIPNPSRFLPL